MMHGYTPVLELVAQYLLLTLTVIWGVSWALVAFHFGAASLTSWRARGGTIRRIPGDFASPVWASLSSFLCLTRMRRGEPLESLPTRFERGHLLRFGIACSSLCQVLLAIVILCTGALRLMSAAMLAVSVAGLLLSLLGAGVHMFVAYRRSPRSWERYLGVIALSLATGVTLALLS